MLYVVTCQRGFDKHDFRSRCVDFEIFKTLFLIKFIQNCNQLTHPVVKLLTKNYTYEYTTNSHRICFFMESGWFYHIQVGIFYVKDIDKSKFVLLE